MTRTQMQQLVVILLLGLFVGVFLLSKKGPEPGRAAVSTPAGRAPAKPPVPPPEAVPVVPPDLSIPRDIFLLPPLLVERLKQRAKKEKKEEKPPGFEPLPAQPLEIPDLELQGIFWGASNPQAIINRQIVSVGDRVEEAEVEAITKESVTLSLNGQKFELKPEIFRSSGKKQR